jgi:hypothetical protein
MPPPYSLQSPPRYAIWLCMRIYISDVLMFPTVEQIQLPENTKLTLTLRIDSLSGEI